MRKAIYDRDIFPVWKNCLLTEVTPDDLRAVCNKVKERGAPATAIHVRGIVKQTYAFAILHGEKVTNPADEVGPASITTLVPKDRSLSPAEIQVLFQEIAGNRRILVCSRSPSPAIGLHPFSPILTSFPELRVLRARSRGR